MTMEQKIDRRQRARRLAEARRRVYRSEMWVCFALGCVFAAAFGWLMAYGLALPCAIASVGWVAAAVYGLHFDAESRRGL